MVDWQKTAFLFPGQGSQEVGMGKDFAETYDIARQTFNEADEILGFSLSTLCFEGPEDELNETINTQPALYVTSIAILRTLQALNPSAQPAFVAGHSLGEFTAFTAAGVLDFESGLRLVRRRGELMQQAGNDNPGAMAALLGMDTDAVYAMCAKISEETGKPLVLANDNCPGQVVISGDSEALDKAVEEAPVLGARRAVKLAVSVAAHSPLMASASAEFEKAIQETIIQAPQIPVYANVTAQPLTDVDAIREEMQQQLTQSVRWTETIQAMISAGADTFVEIGSKDVLSGLMRRIDRDANRVTLNSVEALQAFLES